MGLWDNIKTTFAGLANVNLTRDLIPIVQSLAGTRVPQDLKTYAAAARDTAPLEGAVKFLPFDDAAMQTLATPRGQAIMQKLWALGKKGNPMKFGGKPVTVEEAVNTYKVSPEVITPATRLDTHDFPLDAPVVSRVEDAVSYARSRFPRATTSIANVEIMPDKRGTLADYSPRPATRLTRNPEGRVTGTQSINTGRIRIFGDRGAGTQSYKLTPEDNTKLSFMHELQHHGQRSTEGITKKVYDFGQNYFERPQEQAAFNRQAKELKNVVQDRWVKQGGTKGPFEGFTASGSDIPDALWDELVNYVQTPKGEEFITKEIPKIYQNNPTLKAKYIKNIVDNLRNRKYTWIMSDYVNNVASPDVRFQMIHGGKK